MTVKIQLVSVSADEFSFISLSSFNGAENGQTNYAEIIFFFVNYVSKQIALHASGTVGFYSSNAGLVGLPSFQNGRTALGICYAKCELIQWCAIVHPQAPASGEPNFRNKRFRVISDCQTIFGSHVEVRHERKKNNIAEFPMDLFIQWNLFQFFAAQQQLFLCAARLDSSPVEKRHRPVGKSAGVSHLNGNPCSIAMWWRASTVLSNDLPHSPHTVWPGWPWGTTESVWSMTENVVRWNALEISSTQNTNAK